MLASVRQTMNLVYLIQGRSLSQQDITQLREWVAAHPQWHRSRLSVEIAKAWNWRAPNGRLKDMAARTLLLKLHRRGLINLPAPLHPPARRRPRAVQSRLPLHTVPVHVPVSELTPLSLEPAAPATPCYASVSNYLAGYHYLGHRGPVGEHIAYLARDRQGRDLACLFFGAPAWKAAPRDRFIGWCDDVRAKRVNWITNNTRFLILPWVRVPHLASHVLALALRRLNEDWQTKYGHPVHLVETFVDRSRFKGTCYRAANWVCVGQTQGRSRQDRDRTLSVPVKDVHVYPLVPDFRERLCRLDP